MDYHNKYVKYKHKYLTLKHQNNMIGGSLFTEQDKSNNFEIVTHTKDSVYYHGSINKITSDIIIPAYYSQDILQAYFALLKCLV